MADAITFIRNLELGNKEFNHFKEIIYKESGINLSDAKKALVQSRLMKRIRELRLASYREYYDFLIENYSSEVINLINCITTNKTDFFREPRHFDFLRETVLPAYVESGKKTVRVWSAGCSTGEEPYSIAITISDFYKGKRFPDVKILATDIDTKVLDHGKNGIYKAEILNDIDLEQAKKYFLKGRGENEGTFKVKEFVKKIVYFRRLNLLDNNFPMKQKFDIIFCRNVIIYFDKNTQKRLFNHFYDYLNDDGYLFVGHSETLTGTTDKFYFIKNTIYRKVV